MLEEGLRQRPGDVVRWALLSHALLQDGREAAAAERALRRGLELEPGHAEGRTNLTVLRQRRLQRAGG